MPQDNTDCSPSGKGNQAAAAIPALIGQNEILERASIKNAKQGTERLQITFTNTCVAV
jgi:hypothetical protein